MGDRRATEFTAAINAMSDCESTIEIKIKTLDSNTYTLKVDKCVPVPQLKEEIANVTGVVSEQQRLICRGRVLKDNELLSAYHVEDGHTLHLVVREPDQSSPHAEGNSAFEDTYFNASRHHGVPLAQSIVVEAISIGRQNNEGNLDQVNSVTGPQGPVQSQPSRASLETTPDSITTIFQYLDYVREEFRRAGFDEIDGAAGTASTSTGTRIDDHVQQGFPSATSLAQAIRSTMQLLFQAEGCFSQLTRQIEDQVNISDVSVRANLQANALSSGLLFQNLGYLLLELGRTTTMLRLGQTVAESVVNAGPAVFVSPSGPNPLMVPFYPGSNSSGTGLQGRMLHVASSGEQFGPQILPEQEAFRSSSAGSGIATAGGRVRLIPVRRRTVVTTVPVQAARPPSVSSGSGVGLIIPLQIPETRDHQSSLPHDGTYSSAQPNLGPSLQFPLQPANSTVSENGDDPRARHGVTSENQGLAHLRDSIQRTIQGILGTENVRFVGGEQIEHSASGNQESISITAEAVVGHAEAPEARVVGQAEAPETRLATDDGLHFSNILRQVMPQVMRGNVMASGGSVRNENSSTVESSGNSSGSSQRNLDSAEEPSVKRQRASE